MRVKRYDSMGRPVEWYDDGPKKPESEKVITGVVVHLTEEKAKEYLEKAVSEAEPEKVVKPKSTRKRVAKKAAKD